MDLDTVLATPLDMVALAITLESGRQILAMPLDTTAMVVMVTEPLDTTMERGQLKLILRQLLFLSLDILMEATAMGAIMVMDLEVMDIILENDQPPLPVSLDMLMAVTAMEDMVVTLMEDTVTILEKGHLMLTQDMPMEATVMVDLADICLVDLVITMLKGQLMAKPNLDSHLEALATVVMDMALDITMEKDLLSLDTHMSMDIAMALVTVMVTMVRSYH